MKAMTSLSLAVALATCAGSAAAHAPQPLRLPSGSGASAAYGEIATPSGYEYVQFTDTGSGIGQLDMLYPAGGFAEDDFSREYAIAYPSGMLAAIDTSTAATTPIGATGLGGVLSGPRWDPVTRQSFVMTTDGSGSTLYRIDLASGATTPVGSTEGMAIVAIAIDPGGLMYGVDVLADTLVSVDTVTGTAFALGALGAELPTTDAAMDTDPVSGLIYYVGYDSVAGVMEMYVLDPETGQAVATGPIADTPVSAFALARVGDVVFADGFDGP